MEDEDAENQGRNKAIEAIKPFQWKKGQSGNIMGRPKGKTMKEYARQYLERMTDEERDEWLEGLDKDIVWQMAEGKAKQDTEVSIPQGLMIQFANSFNANTPSSPTEDNTINRPL